MADEINPVGESGGGSIPDVGDAAENAKGGSKFKMPKSHAVSGTVDRVGGAASRGAGKLASKGSKGLNDGASGSSGGETDDFLNDQASELTQEAGDAANEAGQAAKDTVDTVKDVGRDIKDGVDRHRKKKEEEERKKREEDKKDGGDKKDSDGNKGDGDGKKGDNTNNSNGKSGDPNAQNQGQNGSKKNPDSKLYEKGGGNPSKSGGDALKNGSETAANAGKNAIDGAKNTGQAMADGAKTGAEATKAAGQGAQKAGEAAGKVGEAAAKAAEKAVQLAKEAVKVAAEAIKAAAQALAEAMEAIIAFIAEFWWVILIVLVVVALIFGILALCGVFGDSQSVTGDVLTDHESLREENNLEVDNNQQAHQVDISSGTKIITGYYTYYSTKSIWVLFDGMVYNCRTDKESKDTTIDLSKMPKETVIIDGKSYQIVKPVQYGSSEFIEIYKYDPFTGSGLGIDGREVLQDKFQRESSFYLSTEALSSIDEALHHGDFRYPEQLVQKVKYKVVIDDASTGEYHYELDDLADANGVLFKNDVKDESGKIVNYATLSTAYTQQLGDTGIDNGVLTWTSEYNGLWLPITNNSGKVTKKVAGVWDYGFGSILHYLKYIEAHENRGEVVSFEVLHKGIWDVSEENKATTKVPYTLTWTPKNNITHNIGDYLEEKEYTITLFKNAVVETLKYAEWNALSEAEKANYFTGEGKKGDPTHKDFDKSRVYGLPSTTSYMIDWVVTPAGTMTTQVVAEWKDSGQPFSVVENDGGVDYSDDEFNGEDGFDNGTNDTYIFDHEVEILVQKITSDHKATVEFATWGASCINTSTGALTTNPKQTIHYLRYVLTGDDAVDASFVNKDHTAYTTVDGVKQYHLKSVEIKMFDDSGNCNTCGNAAAKITYYKNGHNSCTYYVKKIPVYKNGVNTGTKKDYYVYYSGALTVRSSDGYVTSMPLAKRPPARYNQDTGEFEWNDSDYQTVAGIRKVIVDHWLAPSKWSTSANAVCRCCGYKLGYATYVANNHDSCTTVTYNYDLIDTEEVKLNDEYGLRDGYIQLIRNVEGTKWDKEPRYSGDPDTSMIVGKKYYEDYFNNYSTWVPTAVQSDFNFETMMNQTGLDEEGLLKLLEREPLGDSVAVLGGIEDYFVDGVFEVDDTGHVHGYIGPGLGLIAFEQNMPGSESADRNLIENGISCQPNSVSTLAAEGFPNYGVVQMNRSFLNGFKTWMLEDADRADMWYKIFGDIPVDTTSESTAFSIAWHDSNQVLSDEEYVTFMVYQLAYSYYAKVVCRYETIVGRVPEIEESRAALELMWWSSNNGSLEMGFNGLGGGSPEAAINDFCDGLATTGSWGHYTATMRNKANVHMRRFFLNMQAAELPLFEWDEDKKMFSDVGGSTGGWSIARLWRKLTGAKTDINGDVYYPWEKLYKNSQISITQYTTSDGQIIYGSKDANDAIPRNQYKVNSVAASDIEHEIAKIFATMDKVPISTYKPLTDDFFVLRYQELFSSDLSRKWSTGKKGIANYLPDGWTGVFNKLSTSTDERDTDYRDMKYTVIKEFDKAENPTVKTLVVYGGRNAVDEDGNPIDVTPQPIAIHNVSMGTILEFGSNPELGGTYIAVQYKKSVVYYGNVTPLDDLKVGDPVDKRRLIGFVQSGDYLYLTMKTSVNGTYIDPTPLLKGGLYELVEEARKYLGFDYEWGGHGPVSCFSPRCCKESDHRSYVDGVMWAFDCSGLVTHCARALEMKKDSSSTGWEAMGAGGYATIGEDVTNDYMAGGAIDWYSVPAGTLVFFDWDGGGIDHVGIWSGEESLVHASGGNPYAQNESGGYLTDENGRMVVDAPEKNHAPNDCMIKEYFMGAVPSDAYNSPYAIEHGYNTLRANMFGDYYKSKVVALVDISMYLTDSVEDD